MASSTSTFSMATFLWAIALTVGPGVLGGITYAVSLFLKEIKGKKEDWPPNGHLSLSAFYWSQALTGMGGAVAALLVTLWAKRFPSEADFYSVEEWLQLVCTGFVAGYIANRLLPAIADDLYNRITKLAEKTAAADDKAEEAKQASLDAVQQAKQLTDLANRLSTAMVRASDYLAAREFSSSAKTAAQIKTLTELATSFPTNRTLIFLIVRLYDEANGDRETPVKLLNAFVAAKVKQGEGDDANTADAYWNLATFTFLDVDGKPQEDAALRAQGVQAMKQSLTIMPGYYQACVDDEAFSALKDFPEGLAMLSEAKIRYDAWLKAHPQTGTSAK